MRRKNFTLLLKIRHPNVDPEVLTRMFGFTPLCCWKAGEPKPEGDTQATRRESYWVAEVQPRILVEKSQEHVAVKRKHVRGPADDSTPVMSPADFPFGPVDFPVEGILMLTALLFERKKELWSSLQAEGATAQVIVVFGRSLTTGFELQHNVMTLLSKYGISISVDFRDAVEEAA